MWRQLLPRWSGTEESKEEDVQALFDSWCDRKEMDRSVSFAGIPGLLATCDKPPRRPCTSAFGYDFKPDAVFQTSTETIVLEIKRAAKYEPLVLAQVLHHAEFFETYGSGLLDGKTVRPMIVSSYNCWLRLALAYLFRNKFDANKLLYVEMDWLTDEGRSIVWFDVPFADWKPAKPSLPDFVDKTKQDLWDWHYVENNKSWIGTAKTGRNAEETKRPAVVEGPYVMIAKVEEGQQFVVWQGHGPIRGTSRGMLKNPTLNGDPIGQYFLWDPAQGGGEGPSWIPT